MKIIGTILLAFVFFCSSISTSCSKEITIGVSTGYPPYYYEEKGKLTGICIDIINTIAEDLGITVQYKTYPWKRLLISGEQGSVDAIMPLFRTREREEYLYFDGLEIAYETNYLFTDKHRKLSYNGDLQSLEPYTIGVVTNYSYGDEFDTHKDLQKVVTQNDRHLLDMFTHGRFDIGIGSKYVVLYYARNTGIDKKITFLLPHITKDKLYIGFSKKRGTKELANEFAQALQHFATSNKYTAIMSKYGLQE